MHQELWTKALASRLFTGRTAASCQTRTCSSCSLTSESALLHPLWSYHCNWSLYIYLTAVSVCFPNRPEKMAKLPVLLGNLDVTIDSVAPDVTSKPSKYLLSTSIYNRQTSTLNSVTPLLFPVCRLCHFLLHPREELWRQQARQCSPGGGGVRTLHR